jgi:hypothetical protein
MDGIWGLAAVTAFENLLVEVRGIASGVHQEGYRYALGYLLAAVISSGSVSWVESAILDWVWHIIVLSSLTSGE